MAAETQYVANTGMVTISTANSNLDGTGTLGTVLTAGANNGTLIKTITVKATGNTTQGMVRIFVGQSGSPKLVKEVEIPAVTKSATDPAFEIVVPFFFYLKANYVLSASTENAESFNIIAEAQNWLYYTTSVRAETTKYEVYNAGTTISTANSNLDGTGTMGNALISSGCNIQAVTIKARQSTTAGMVRLFLYNNSAGITRLFREIPVPATTASSTSPTFYYRLIFENGFALKSGWYLKVSTEKAEGFNVIPESLDWTYPA